MLKVWVDGACRPIPGKGGIGVLFEGDRMSYSISEKLPGDKLTSNHVEYLAFNRALTEIMVYGFSNEEIIVHSDSKLLVLQLTNQESVDKGSAYLSSYIKAKELVKHFPRLTIKHIPRSSNSEANLLASKGTRK